MPRRGTNFEQGAAALHERVLQAAGPRPRKIWPSGAKTPGALAEQTSWRYFFTHYIEAFQLALEKADTRICHSGNGGKA